MSYSCNDQEGLGLPFGIQRVCLQFPSKKNRVFLVNLASDGHSRPAVLKVHPFPGPALRRERGLLEEAERQGLAVPRLLDHTESSLLLEFIAGETLCDLVNRELDPRPLEELARWLADFHRRFPGLVRGDSQLKNFIWHRSRVFGIDFEECSQGQYVEDVAGICSSILDTNPMFTPAKFELTRTFLTMYEALNLPIKDKQLHREIANTLRRKVRFRPGQQDTLLLQAQRIEEKGVRGLIP